MSFLKTKTGIVFIGFMLIAGYQLVVEHGAHLAPYAPWLILLACPLMHLFMHHGHGGYGHGDRNHRDEEAHAPGDDKKQDISIEQGGYGNGNQR